MPELPEVETIKEQLSSYMPLHVEKLWLSKVHKSIVHTPLKKIEGQTLLSITRLGKMLIFNFESTMKMLSHLGMTGTWRISTEELKEKHLHIELTCKNIKSGEQYYLSYVDPRRFGHLYYLSETDAKLRMKKLGTDLTTITISEVESAIKKFPNRLIKVHLLDQKYFAGSGNYIASEICAHAKILPHRICSSLSRSEIKKIHTAIANVINQNIKSGGAAFAGGYQDANGNKGEGVKNLTVFYQKICQNCLVTPVIKTILAQRGTYHCPKCQQ